MMNSNPRTDQLTANSWRQSAIIPLGFLLPAILLLLAFQVGPSIYAMYLSFTRVRAGQSSFVGIANYIRLFNSPSFTDSLMNTLVYSSAFIALTVGLGLMIALLINRRIRYSGAYLVMIFVPWVISDVVVGTIWRWLFQPNYGLLQNWITRWLPELGTSLFTSAEGAMGIVIAASVWQGLAFTTILSLGALQTVSHEIIESAALDGADRLRRLVYIILPMIQRQLLVMVVLTSIRAINSVGLIFTITGGGPGGATRTASVYLLETGWERGDFGTGAAISIILLVVNLVLTVGYIWLLGSSEENQTA